VHANTGIHANTVVLANTSACANTGAHANTGAYVNTGAHTYIGFYAAQAASECSCLNFKLNFYMLRIKFTDETFKKLSYQYF